MEKKNVELQTAFIKIDARVSYECLSNTVEINIKREKKEFLMRQKDGRLVVVESSKAPPFPIPHLVLKNIISFEPNNIYSLLYSALKEDFMLCSSLTREIVYQAKQASGKKPMYIIIDVTLTPQTVSGDFTSDVMETCTICLKEADDLTELKCSHTFHDDCITLWLCENNTCPVCRTIIEDSDDDHPYYSD